MSLDEDCQLASLQGDSAASSASQPSSSLAPSSLSSSWRPQRQHKPNTNTTLQVPNPTPHQPNTNPTPIQPNPNTHSSGSQECAVGFGTRPSQHVRPAAEHVLGLHARGHGDGRHGSQQSHLQLLLLRICFVIRF